MPELLQAETVAQNSICAKVLWLGFLQPSKVLHGHDTAAKDVAFVRALSMDYTLAHNMFQMSCLLVE